MKCLIHQVLSLCLATSKSPTVKVVGENRSFKGHFVREKGPRLLFFFFFFLIFYTSTINCSTVVVFVVLKPAQLMTQQKPNGLVLRALQKTKPLRRSRTSFQWLFIFFLTGKDFSSLLKCHSLPCVGLKKWRGYVRMLPTDAISRKPLQKTSSLPFALKNWTRQGEKEIVDKSDVAGAEPWMVK